MPRGLVTKSTGKFYDIKDVDNGSIVVGIIRGKFKLQGLKLTNPVAVGDFVWYERENDEVVLITQIESRENYVVRQSPRKKHYLHLLACNIDQALVIVTITQPNLKQGFIDRFLLMTEPYNIPVIIVFNKWDLYGRGDKNVFHYLKEIYEKIGYTVIHTSATEGVGISNLQSLLYDKSTLVAGQSGVGKSSLINAIEPHLEIKTQSLSDRTGKGQHTTTFATMHQLSTKGNIIDTPGIKTLSFNHFEVMDIAHNFREFFALSSSCKYADCTHRDEPKCAVKEALESGEVSELRYFNYLRLLEEVENQNYWERIKDY